MQSTSEKLAKGDQLRLEGNTYYSTGQFKKAIRCYHESLLHVQGLDRAKYAAAFGFDVAPLTAFEQSEIIRISMPCYNNLAVCLAKEEKWDKVVTYCTKVLEVEPNNTKALYRRGEAYLKLKDIDRADVDLKKVLEKEPNDPKLKNALVELKRLQAIHHEKEKIMFKDLFSRMNLDSSSSSSTTSSNSSSSLEQHQDTGDTSMKL